MFCRAIFYSEEYFCCRTLQLWCAFDVGTEYKRIPNQRGVVLVCNFAESPHTYETSEYSFCLAHYTLLAEFWSVRLENILQYRLG